MAGGGFPPPSQSHKKDMAATSADDEGPVPPFPLKNSIILGLVLVNESLCANMLLPFIGLFVAHLQGRTAEEAGFASGFLVAVFQLGQVFTGKKWGRLSDKYGRRPAMQLGLIFSGIVMLLFGICPNIYVGIFLRLIHGLVNGNILVAKAMLPEVMGHKKHEPKGYAIPSLTWCLGTLVGPAIGGALYDPTRYGWFPFTEDSIFGTNPALLPSMVIGGYSFFALFVCIFFLPETNKNAQPLKLPWNKELTKVSEETEVQQQHQQQLPPKTKFGYKQAFQNPLTRTVLILYMVISFSDIAFFEILPLWAVSGRSFGGLAMPSETVGLVILINGLPGIFANFLFSTMLNKVGGPTQLLRIATTMWIISAFAEPFAYYFEGTTGVAVLSCFLIVRVIGAAWSFSPNFLLIGRTAPPGHLGSINGIAQSLGCATRTLAPILVAPLYAWSISSPHPFPFNYHLAFIVGWAPLLANYSLTAIIDRYPHLIGLAPKEVDGAMDIEPPTDDSPDFEKDSQDLSIIATDASLLKMQCEDVTRKTVEDIEQSSLPTISIQLATGGLVQRSRPPTPMPTPKHSYVANDSLNRRPPILSNNSIGGRPAAATGASQARLGSSLPHNRRLFIFGQSPNIDPELILRESESQQNHPSELSI